MVAVRLRSMLGGVNAVSCLLEGAPLHACRSICCAPGLVYLCAGHVKVGYQSLVHGTAARACIVRVVTTLQFAVTGALRQRRVVSNDTATLCRVDAFITQPILQECMPTNTEMVASTLHAVPVAHPAAMKLPVFNMLQRHCGGGGRHAGCTETGHCAVCVTSGLCGNELTRVYALLPVLWPRQWHLTCQAETPV
jgi:hypothetical protein